MQIVPMPRFRKATGCLAVSLLVVLGCQTSTREPASTLATVDNAASPSELVQQINSTQQDINAQGELYRAKPLSFRKQQIARQVQSGMDLCDRLLQHAEATAEQRELAHNAKVELLGQGLQYDCAECLEQLTQLARQLEADVPDSPAAEYASAMVLEQTTKQDKPFEETMAALQAHAARYPNGQLGVRLYQAYADHLLRNGQRQEATQCCQTALHAYAAHPDRHLIEAVMMAITQQEAQSAARAADERRVLQEIYNALGQRQQGYFVIDAQQKNSKGFFVRVEYPLCHGINEVVTAVRNLPNDWTWKLHSWYPDSAQGLAQAMAAQEKLYSKTTTMPVFGNSN
jgi:hypothetical protein